MPSRIYTCSVRHCRLAPKRHQFRHRIFMLGIDLDELPVLRARHRVLGINRPGLFSLREADYLPGAIRPEANLKDRVLERLAGVALPDRVARVDLVTMPRVAGYLFNPVSFYFCYGNAGQPLVALAEVTNTFREVKVYPVKPDAGGRFHLRTPKHFYVSPFSDVDVAFDFTLRPAGDFLSIQIDDYTGETRTLTSTLRGRARPLTDARLLWYAVKYPFLTASVMTLIHWHAFRLYLKGVPWFRKSARPADQRGLHHPHRSLTSIDPSRA